MKIQPQVYELGEAETKGGTREEKAEEEKVWVGGGRGGVDNYGKIDNRMKQEGRKVVIRVDNSSWAKL